MKVSGKWTGGKVDEKILARERREQVFTWRHERRRAGSRKGKLSDATFREEETEKAGKREK